MKRILNIMALPVALGLLLALSGASFAQEPIKHEKEPVTIKATIEAIDHDTRMVTLKGKDGVTRSIYAGPEVRRFDELKVGQEVTFHITESVVYKVRKAGESVPPSGKDDPAIVREASAKPSGTKTTQETKIVTIKEIDTKAGAVTVQTEDGKTVSYKLQDKDLMKGLAVGDRIVMSFTKAVAVSIE